MWGFYYMATGAIKKEKKIELVINNEIINEAKELSERFKDFFL